MLKFRGFFLQNLDAEFTFFKLYFLSICVFTDYFYTDLLYPAAIFYITIYLRECFIFLNRCYDIKQKNIITQFHNLSTSHHYFHNLRDTGPIHDMTTIKKSRNIVIISSDDWNL